VSTAKTTNKDLSVYDTFAYLPNTDIDMPDASFDDQSVNEAVLMAINSNLRQAGYTLNQENPDLLVLIRTETDTEVATTTNPVYAAYPYNTGMMMISPFYGPYYYSGYAGYNNIIGYDRDTYRYKEGTVVIHLVDRKTRNTVWKGVASESLYDQTSTEAIQDLVNAIFEEYPLFN